MPACARLPAWLVALADGLSAAGCLAVLVAAARVHTFELKLSACFALAVLSGLPVWLLPHGGSLCQVQALLEQFSYLASMIWAVICLLHVYIVVNLGSRVAWRLEALYHIVGWGGPLLSLVGVHFSGTVGVTELGSCWIDDTHPWARLLFYFAPLGLSLAAMLGLLGLVMAQMLRGNAAQPPALRAATRRKLRELAGFLLGFLILNVPHVARELGPPLDPGRPCDAQPASAVFWESMAELSVTVYGLLPVLLLLAQAPARRALSLILRTAGRRPDADFSAAGGLLPPGAMRSDDLEAGTEVAGGPPLAATAPPAREMRTLRVWAGTWNLGNTPPAPMHAWLPADGFDVVVVAAQECQYKGARRAWFAQLEEALGPGFAVLGARSLLGVRLLVAVRRDLARHARLTCLAAHGTGLLRLYGNKGAVGCLLWLGETSVCFVGAHLAAHAHHLARRNQDMRQLLAGLRLGLGTADLQAEVHHVFVLGDLNYRLQRDPLFAGRARPDPAYHAEVLGKVAAREWPSLLQCDQLRAAVSPSFLHGFVEGAPFFAPTFKLQVGRRLEYKKSRIPSYCDRVLWHSAPEHAGRLRQRSYASCDALLSSDHAAVFATFELDVPTPLAPPPAAAAAAAAAGGPLPRLRVQLRELGACRLDLAASAAAAPENATPEAAAAAAAAAVGAPLYVSICGSLFGAADAPDAPCGDAVAARPMRGAAGHAGMLQAAWTEAQLPSAAVRHAGGDVVAVREQLLVLLLRDLDLLGTDDLLGVATVPLLRLEAVGTPMRFRAPLLRASRVCGEVEGSLVLLPA